MVLLDGPKEQPSPEQPSPVVRPEVWETYGPADLSAVPVFAGGFINFGYWKAVDLGRSLSQGDRIRSEQDLYRHVLDAVAPEGGRAVEVGCGLGLGCALTLEEYGPTAVTGVDIHPQQLQRAREANSRSSRHGRTGSASCSGPRRTCRSATRSSIASTAWRRPSTSRT